MREAKKLSLRSSLARALAAAAAFSFTMTSAQAASVVVDASAISCRLTLPAELTAAQPAVLTVTLHNQSPTPIYLLKRNTPLEGWLADSLQISRDGQRLPYAGAMAKRAAPTVAEYLVLQPRATHRQAITLAGGYDVTQPGKYVLAWSGQVMDLRSRRNDIRPDTLAPVALGCNEVEFVRKR